MAGPTIYYVRHGETDWNAEQRFQGRKDIPLNEKGRAQARHNGGKLADILGTADGFSFISSPLSRSRETMEIIRAEMSLAKDGYSIDERLIEVSYGDLEGITQPELKQMDRELYYFRKKNAWSFRPQNGESQKDVLGRVRDWYSNLEPDGRYVVAAHGAVGRVVRHHLAGMPADDVARYPFPQDQVFVFSGGKEQII